MARSNRKFSSLADRFDSLRANAGVIFGSASSFAACALLLALLGLVWWGVPRLRDRLEAKAIAAGDPGTVAYTSAPPWFDALRQSEVSQRVAQAVGPGSVLDPNRLGLVRAALESTGWFESIEQVRLADQGGFLVDATFVRPFAVIRHGEFDYLVDVDARLLPLQWAAGHRPASPHYVAIVGAADMPAGDFGTKWPGGDVAGGLELAKFLAKEPWFEQIAAIDVSQLPTRNEASLITTGGGRLLWGRLPNDRTAAEVPPESKIRSIATLHASTGRIDTGAGRIIDLRSDVVTVHSDPTMQANASGSGTAR